MKGVLVDTSVWIDHFRHRNDGLVDLLELDLVMSHALVLGEIACGTPPYRVQTLTDLDRLQQTQQASVREAMTFVERVTPAGWRPTVVAHAQTPAGDERVEQLRALGYLDEDRRERRLHSAPAR